MNYARCLQFDDTVLDAVDERDGLESTPKKGKNNSLALSLLADLR